MARSHSQRQRQRGRGDVPPPNWGERVLAMRNLPPFLASVWQTHRGYTAAIVALRLFRAFVPVATLWVGK
ncbi:MAG: hypothetical protein WD031_04030, partial [Gemmatimonadota bacterium]